MNLTTVIEVNYMTLYNFK